MRGLLDTNVLVSAILFGGVPQECLRRGLAGEFVLVTGVALLDELERTLRDRFDLPSEVASFVRGDLEVGAQVVTPSHVDRVSRDPGDDVVLAVSREARADYVVTGDKDLLILGRYEGATIVTPRQFLDVLAARPPADVASDG